MLNVSFHFLLTLTYITCKQFYQLIPSLSYDPHNVKTKPNSYMNNSILIGDTIIQDKRVLLIPPIDNGYSTLVSDNYINVNKFEFQIVLSIDNENKQKYGNMFFIWFYTNKTNDNFLYNEYKGFVISFVLKPQERYPKMIVKAYDNENIQSFNESDLNDDTTKKSNGCMIDLFKQREEKVKMFIRYNYSGNKIEVYYTHSGTMFNKCFTCSISNKVLGDIDGKQLPFSIGFTSVNKIINDIHYKSKVSIYKFTLFNLEQAHKAKYVYDYASLTPKSNNVKANNKEIVLDLVEVKNKENIKNNEHKHNFQKIIKGIKNILKYNEIKHTFNNIKQMNNEIHSNTIYNRILGNNSYNNIINEDTTSNEHTEIFQKTKMFLFAVNKITMSTISKLKSYSSNLIFFIIITFSLLILFTFIIILFISIISK